MDYLDPHKTRRHAILLYTGYFFIGIAILFSALVLVYQANGFGVNSKGQVVQNGLVFVSSQPNPATIFLNDEQNTAQTNSRLSLTAGQYSLRLTRDGYRDWARDILVQGGDVQNYDYPFLFPKTLETNGEADYATAPGIASQSRDRRWLVVQKTPTATSYDVYDLKEETDMIAESISLPTASFTASSAAQTWEVIQWANDNQHFLLKHTFGASTEYLIVDREQPEQTINLNKTLNSTPSALTLVDNKYDQYHLLLPSGELFRASLGEPQPVSVLKNVLNYKSFGTGQILYATNLSATAGKVSVSLLDGDKTYPIREVAAGSTYQLDIADYRGARYVILAATSESMAYVYKDVVGQLKDPAIKTPVATRALRVAGATHVSFSPSTRYILAENGGNIGVYDIFLKRAYVYSLKDPIDAPQTKATWMDGDHLTLVSGGKQMVWDFDGRNRQTLMPASAAQSTFFAQDYRYVFGFAPNSAGVTQLQRTALRTSTDL